jgi:hypothetical protein
MTVHRHFLTVINIVLGVTAFPTLAGSGEIPPRGPVPFEAFDSNGDGYIDEQEFSRVRSERAQQRSAEGRMMRNQCKAPQFSDLDTNGDGRVSPQEHRAHQQQRRQTRCGSAQRPAR